MHDIPLRRGRTLYTRLGNNPFVAAAVVLLAAAWLLDHRARRSADPRQTSD